MDIEKIIYLVALAVYGILSTVLSVVRTLKTSKISSEVKAVLPPTIDGQPVDDEQLIDNGQLTDAGQPNDDVQDVQKLSIDDVLSVISDFLNRKG